MALNRGAAFVANEVNPSLTAVTAAFAATAGRLLSGYVMWEDEDTTVLSVADLASGTWVIGTRRRAAGGESMLTPFWCLSTPGHATNVITVTMNASCAFISAAGREFYMDDAGTWAADDEDSADTSAGTTFVTPSVTLAGASQPVVVCVSTYSSQTFTDNEYAVISLMNSGGRGVFDLLGSGPGNVAPNIQWTDVYPSVGGIITHKFTATGGASPTNRLTLGVGAMLAPAWWRWRRMRR
jgi:hypothetical protein